jgi:hypothetical protein
MAAWVQALLARSRLAELAGSNPTEPVAVTTIEREWVLALTALVLGPTDRREVRHG